MALLRDRENGRGCQDLADDMRRRYPIVRKNACVSALQESQRYVRARVCVCVFRVGWWDHSHLALQPSFSGAPLMGNL